MEIVEYADPDGLSPFARWFADLADLDAVAAAKVTIAFTRIGHGNLSNAKSVGAGVHELKIDFGPGYRVYFGIDGGDLVILLAGGSKKRQQRDIATAQDRWADYKLRKKREA